MRKRVLTALIVVSAFALGACQEDATMDELIDDIELNATAADPDDDDTNPPGGNG